MGVTLPRRKPKANAASALTAETRTVPVAGGREVTVLAWRDDAGELVRITIASRWASDPEGVHSRSVTLPPDVLPQLTQALTELAP